MNDIWTNRLSDYLDGELDNAERIAVEDHLATCGHCYATLGELRQVVARAQALQDTPPANDLWTGIVERIRHETTVDRFVHRERRRFSFSVPQLLAASIALVAMSSGTAYVMLHSPRAAVTPAPDVAFAPSPAPPDVRNVEQRWKLQSDMAIAELQDALTANESKLDTGTVRIVRENLAIIDRAIGQAQKALRRDPRNSYLNLHLANTMRQKIELLRRANALAAGES